jgi:hypothetical protein
VVVRRDEWYERPKGWSLVDLFLLGLLWGSVLAVILKVVT